MTAPDPTTTGQATLSGVAAHGRGGRMVPPAAPRRDYYGRPVIAAPVWTWEIPLYFFAGGLAGASAPLAAAAGLRGNRALARNAAAAAFGGAAVSPLLLISDLGRPLRFLNMLRMFKPTSPMSVGVWLLAGFAPCAALGAGREWLGVLRSSPAARAGQLGAAVLGPGLATYTAALIANTAVPVWHDARHALPFVFAGSSLASAGGLAAAVTHPRAAAPARRMALGGAALGVAASQVMERRLAEPVRRPYRSGLPAWLMRASLALTAGGGAALALAGRRRAGAIAGGAALVAGAALERWAIVRAGFASAEDPRATVDPQRARRAGLS